MRLQLRYLIQVGACRDTSKRITRKLLVMVNFNQIIEFPDDNSQDENEIVIFPENDSSNDLAPSTTYSKPLQLVKFVPQILREGKTPAALILALGAIAVPLAILQSNLVAGILAGGAVMVAVIYAIGAIICQRRNG